MRTANAYALAYWLGIAQSRQPGARNPYLPAEPDTAQMWLAKCWRAGRLFDLPASFRSDAELNT